MTPLANTSFGSCLPPCPPGGQVRTALVAPPPAAGAEGFMSQGSAAVEARAAHNREVAGSTPAPATILPTPGSHGGLEETAPAPSASDPGAVILSDASAFVLSLVAAHEGRRPEDVLALLIAGAAEAIGIHSLIMRDADQVDLADLPDFALRAANRFRGGGP